jgi:hypothetical protein
MATKQPFDPRPEAIASSIYLRRQLQPLYARRLLHRRQIERDPLDGARRVQLGADYRRNLV